MKLIIAFAVLATAGLAAPHVLAGPLAASSVVHVYKSPSCICCGKWIEHMEEEGFQVEVHVEADMLTRKTELGVPREMFSCHTSVVDGRPVEGHVPASAVRAMVSDPSIEGIAVAGMPPGSPGMQEDGSAFTVHAFDREGHLSVFSEH